MTNSWRFESLLKLHRHHRDAAQIEVAFITDQLASIEDERTKVRHQRRTLRQDPRRQQQGRIDVDVLRQIDQREQYLKKILSDLDQQYCELSAQLATKRAELISIQQDVQRMERLQQKDLDQLRQHRGHIAQRQSDEQAAQAFARDRV